MKRVQENIGKNPPDCYFFAEGSGDQKTIACLCLQCAKGDKEAWFWKGSEKGYGPFLFKCSKCNGIIYDPDQEKKKEKKRSGKQNRG